MRVELDGNRAVSYEVFASGWLQSEEAWGRPVDVQVMPDGALLVSDDEAGVHLPDFLLEGSVGASDAVGCRDPVCRCLRGRLTRLITKITYIDARTDVP